MEVLNKPIGLSSVVIIHMVPIAHLPLNTSITVDGGKWQVCYMTKMAPVKVKETVNEECSLYLLQYYIRKH